MWLFININSEKKTFFTLNTLGFHEAIGDVMELSVSTPEHLFEVGLLPDYEPNEGKLIVDIKYTLP